MRFSTSVLSLILAAGMASAAPMRIVVLSETIQYKGVSEASQHNPLAGNVHMNIIPVAADNGRAMSRRPCALGKTSIVDMFRHALGLAPADKHHEDKMAATVIGSPIAVSFDRETYEGHTKGGDRIKIMSMPPPPPVSMHYREPAMARLHKALMMLGPWEGRAVAFVLGCGLGVLLRIAYLALLLTYRAITQSGNEDDTEEEYLAPPILVNYQYVDEKQPILFEDNIPELVEASVKN